MVVIQPLVFAEYGVVIWKAWGYGGSRSARRMVREYYGGLEQIISAGNRL
jgi:hypothetical protein